jgi:Ribbon-helix-helix protein, copG family
MANMRVNARFDDEAARQLDELVQMTGQGVTQLLKDSVTHYAQWLRGDGKPRLLHLRAARGQYGSGRADVSSTSKELLAQSLRSQHTASAPAAKKAARGRR